MSVRASRCPGPIRRLFARLRSRRRDRGCGDWYTEPPPDIGVREPRRPLPGSGSSSAVLDPPGS